MKDLSIFHTETDIKEEFTSDYLIIKANIIINHKKIISINELYDVVQNEYKDVILNKQDFKELIFQEFYSDKNNVESIDVMLSNELNLFFNKNAKRNKDEYSHLVIECLDIVYGNLPISILNLSNAVKANHNNVLNISAFKKFVNRHFIVNKNSITGIKKQTTFYYNTSKLSQKTNDCLKNSINDIIANIDSSNEHYLINDYHFDSFDILNQNGIVATRDLMKFDKDKLYEIVKNNFVNFEKDVSKLIVPYFDFVSSLIREQIGNRIDNRTQTILLERNGHFQNHAKTLEELGKELNLTRERVRQLEAKGKKALSLLTKEYFDELCFVLNRLFNNKSYLSIEEVFKFVNDDVDTYCYLLLINNLDNDFEYCSEYHLIYNTHETSIKEIENKVEDKYGNFVPLVLYESADRLEKSIINNLYTYNEKKKLYKIKNLRLADLVDEIIFDIFPDGYKTYDENDYNRFLSRYIQLYGEDSEAPTIVSIRGIVDRNLFCQYDRGKVISRRHAVKLDKSLITKILDYISNYEDIVYYTSIFEAFKDELHDYGIKNRYYLKGIIDFYLPREYVTKRDYISVSEDFISSSESIKREIECFKGEFSISDLQEKYPCVKEYVFQVIMSDRDDAIWLSGKSFILLKNLVISDKLKETLINEIDFLFAYLSSDFVSSGKIFSRMMIMHEDLMNTIPIINDKYKLISLISVILSNKYTIIRQYITKGDKDINVTAYSLVEDFIKNKDIFSITDIKDYCEKMNIRGLYSFQEFMIDNSDEYVQINIDTCVRKDLLSLSDSNLTLIKKELDYYINSFGPIYTEKYNSYSRFPNVKYVWNKYLLVGIVRSYLDIHFEIEYTENISTKTDYIIRRVRL